MAQGPLIHPLTAPPGPVAPYAKYELAVSLTAAYTNPYDYTQVRLWATVISPQGESREIDGFYLQPYAGPDSAGQLTPAGAGGFRWRFAPDQPGFWTLTLALTDSQGTTTAPPISLLCAGSLPEAGGFIRRGSAAYLRRDDGRPFVPLGHNLAWPAGNPILAYRRWLDRLHEQEANTFRVWQCDWGLGLEGLGPGYPGLGRYRQDHAAYLDWLFEAAAQRGMALLLCLHHHGQVSTSVDPKWGQNPYNTAQGGMCAEPAAFFTHPQARAWTRNRLRYLIARYGYAHSLLAWELFNEVDWTDDYLQHQGAIADWHEEMSDFLQAHDPYQHLVTTSFARASYDPLVWTLPGIDFTQTHHYAATPHLEQVLTASLRSYRDAYGKPTLTGEFGLRTGGHPLDQVDPDGIHLHNSLWASFFGGGAGAGLSWWWDTYIDPQHLYFHYGPLAARMGELPLIEGALAPAAAEIRDAPGDRVLTPSLGWGELGSAPLTLLPDGSLHPPEAALSTYLYGSQWNTQYRRPPVFQVDYPSAGSFTVQTGATTGQAPVLSIRLNGVLIWQQPAQVHTSYTVPIPAGAHSLSVDNTGTDWISIASYTFGGLGQGVDAYVLRAADGRHFAAWLLNPAYTHTRVYTQGPPPPVEGATLLLPAAAAGLYEARWYDCLSGALLHQEPLSASDDTLRLALPSLTWDLALQVSPAPLPGTAPGPLALRFRAFPNPWERGPLSVAIDLPQAGPVQMQLIDPAGRPVANWPTADRPAGPQTWSLPLPPALSAGLYFLRISTPGYAGTTLLQI